MHQKLLSPAEQLSSPCVGCHIFHMLLFGKETNLGEIIWKILNQSLIIDILQNLSQFARSFIKWHYAMHGDS